jgi:hypothetical protein
MPVMQAGYPLPCGTHPWKRSISTPLTGRIVMDCFADKKCLMNGIVAH